ncbi:MAG: insulinase family protein [Gammaproteobacteria bacterium]|nr:insulinase family protein [Gammaproteobacteria bacterium]
MARRSVLAILVCMTGLVMGTGSAAALQPDQQVIEKTLDNGLKVLVKPDHRAPVVVSQVWYKVGSSDEPAGLTGLSHVLEHMMFKGTQELGPNEFSRIIAANGGRENAFTGRDYTAYFQRIASGRLEICFRLEADRMQNLKIEEEEFRKEVEVVKEERRLRTDDRPESLTYEKFMATAYREHKYRNPIIGWPQDLESMTVKDLRDWYEKWYAPNNATLVVVGDVEPEVVFELAQKHFGPIERRKVAPRANEAEPEHGGPRRVSVEAPAQVPYLLMGYRVPVIENADSDDWEPYALEILAYILDGGKSARLSTELVRNQQIVSSVGAGYDPTARAATQFLFDANPNPGKNIANVERAIRAEIKRVQTDLVSDQELARVKAQIVANKIYERDSVFYQAMKLGGLETVGLDWRLEQKMTERLRAVTAEQVKKVASKYLVDQNLTVAVLVPGAKSPAKES